MQIQTPRNHSSIGGSENFIIQVITWTLITVALNFPHSLLASENRTNNLDKVCSFISDSINDANSTEGNGPHIISDKSGKTVAELNFKPSKSNWKIVSLFFWEGQDFPTTQVRAVPPCKIISARQFGRTADGDKIIISYGTDLKVRSTEPQNPPFMMAGQPVQAPSEPLLALVDTGVNYNLPMVQKHLALGQDGQLIGYDFWDNDNRPFDKDPRKNAFFPLHHGTTVFSALSQELGDLKAANIKNIKLPVSAPFHCKLMSKATLVMNEEIEKLNFKEPENKLISNVTGKEISDSNKLKDLLVKQIESRVRWRESVLLMIEKGVTQFIEIGPGKVLSGLVKRIDKNVKVSAINSEEDIKLININE